MNFSVLFILRSSVFDVAPSVWLSSCLSHLRVRQSAVLQHLESDTFLWMLELSVCSHKQCHHQCICAWHSVFLKLCNTWLLHSENPRLKFNCSATIFLCHESNVRTTVVCRPPEKNLVGRQPHQWACGERCTRNTL